MNWHKLCTACLFTLSFVHPATQLVYGQDFPAQLKAAKPGETVSLPAGEHALGDLEVPAGVTLEGAGYKTTILNAAGHANGIVLRGEQSQVRSLTVKNAIENGLLIDGVKDAIVSRVVAADSVNGVLVRNSTGVRVSNLVSWNNRAGVAFNGCKDSSLVNSSLLENDATALLIAKSSGLTVFNNVLAYSQLGVRIGEGVAELALDHNFYVCNFAGVLGKAPVNPARKQVEAWSHFSGYDQHSLMAPLRIEGQATLDFRNLEPLVWSPNRASTSDFGVAQLAKVTAPETDIDGLPRAGGVDLGATEVSFPTDREPDGVIEVKSGAGVTSAGIFAADDKLVRYLFQNLPLAKGRHPYWLPSRDWQGRPIVAGAYRLKVTESDLRLEYVAAAGNGDLELSKQVAGGPEIRSTLDPHAAAFDEQGRVYLAQSGFESGVHLRSFSPDMSKLNWHLPGGGDVAGVAVMEGKVCVLRRPASLLVVDAETGGGVFFNGGTMERGFEQSFQSVSGMSALGGKLYVADTKASKVLAITLENPSPAELCSVNAPTWPSADASTKLIWVISAEKELVACDEQGTEKARFAPVPKPTLLAVNNGTLGVYSAETNQITLFDVRNPAAPVKLRTIGSGGESYGKIVAEKFWAPRSIALDAKGGLLVIDAPRIIAFNADGTPQRQWLGMWGQGITWGMFTGDARPHFFNIGGTYDIAIDPQTKSWEPGSRWKLPFATDAGAAPIYFWNVGGKNYGTYFSKAGLSICELPADGLVKQRVLYSYNPSQQVQVQRDGNNDGIINEADPPQVLAGVDGQPITTGVWQDARALSGVDYRGDNAMVIPHRNGFSITPLELTATWPEYNFAKRQMLEATVEGKPLYKSPYDFTTEETVSLAEDLGFLADGGYAALISTKTGAGPDLASEHANSTSMAGFDAAGSMRWLYPLNPNRLKMGFHGVTTIGGITLTGRAALCQFETMDADGLGTGLLGTPFDMMWAGMWLDNHRQIHGFSADRPYLVIGDYANQAYHWLSLTGTDKLIRTSETIVIKPELAAKLSADAPVAIADWPVPNPPTIKVSRLSAPLPIDGDPEKWRKLGIPPLVVTPDLNASEPTDTSAIIRFGYHGENLYVQIIKFDDLITMFQRDRGKHYLQDGMEMAINSFPEGFKYNVTRLADGQDMVFRDTWRANFGQKELEQLIPAATAPRVIKILDDATSIEDRKIIEASYGVDMSRSKVMLIEFMVPKSAMSPMGNPKLEVDFKPGASFRLGFMLNDNDTPGADAMNPVVWPVTYGTFEREDKGATAVFE